MAIKVDLSDYCSKDHASRQFHKPPTTEINPRMVAAIPHILTLVSPKSSDGKVHAAKLAMERTMVEPKFCSLLSESEARAFLGGISRTTLWRLRRAGVPCNKLGRRLLFDVFELTKFIKEHQEKSYQNPTEKQNEHKN